MNEFDEIAKAIYAEIARLEARITDMHARYAHKPLWYKQQYTERRLKKLRNKVDAARERLTQEQARILDEKIAKAFPGAKAVLRI